MTGCLRLSVSCWASTRDKALEASGEASAERRNLRLLFTVVPMGWLRCLLRLVALAGRGLTRSVLLGAGVKLRALSLSCGVGCAALGCAVLGCVAQCALRRALGVWPQWLRKRLLKCDAVAKPSSAAMSAMGLRLWRSRSRARSILHCST